MLTHATIKKKTKSNTELQCTVFNDPSTFLRAIEKDLNLSKEGNGSFLHCLLYAMQNMGKCDNNMQLIAIYDVSNHKIIAAIFNNCHILFISHIPDKYFKQITKIIANQINKPPNCFVSFLIVFCFLCVMHLVLIPALVFLLIAILRILVFFEFSKKKFFIYFYIWISLYYDCVWNSPAKKNK